MQIAPKTIQYAILGIFKGRGVVPGGSIPLDVMAKEWRATRLRGADLQVGLEMLETAGHISMARTHFGTDVHLVNERFGEVVTEEDRKAAAAVVLARKIRGPAPSYVAAKERLGTTRRRAADKTDKPPRR